MSDFVKGLVPALLAGLVGGVGAYTAVRVDVAVLTTNQEGFKKDLAIVRTLSEGKVRQDGQLEFLQYQVDTLRDELGDYVKVK